MLAADSFTQAGNEADEIDYGRLKGKRILLAEDNDLNAEIAMEFLTEAGLFVERVTDGLACVNQMDIHEGGYYDLILMDIQMPAMDGYKAASLIRGMPDERRRRIPIYAMTANAFEEDRANAIAAGMNGHIAKPIEPKALFVLLARAL
ncbi:MAG: response regulator [Desulfovibrio sp.]|nr:response regulator [Desulfovibrio sp.]